MQENIKNKHNQKEKEKSNTIIIDELNILDAKYLRIDQEKNNSNQISRHNSSENIT